MSDFKFSCPHCSQHLQCDEQFSGRQIQCPHCDHLICIPPAPGKTAQYNAESGMTWATYVSPANAPSKESAPAKPPSGLPKPGQKK